MTIANSVLGFHSTGIQNPTLASFRIRFGCAFTGTRSFGYKWTNTNRSESSGMSEKNCGGPISRKDFFPLISATSSAIILAPRVGAFDGGVGGLGKTKPETGVIFSNPDISAVEQTSSGQYSAELLSPDGTTALLSFYAAWPFMRSSGIESRDLANPEASFVQVAPFPEGKSLQADNLTASFFTSSLFSSSGKFGAYSAPLDIKIKKMGKHCSTN